MLITKSLLDETESEESNTDFTFRLKSFQIGGELFINFRNNPSGEFETDE